MTHVLTLQEIKPVTHDTYQLTFNRPDGFEFVAGQATELAIQKEGWEDEGRPFTMTSRPSDRHLEFVIKSYPDHNGMTEQIPKLGVGDQVKASAPFGAIKDYGPGVFLAGGAGVTPFISILRKQQEEGKSGSHLIFANKTDRVVILEDTWRSMPGLKATFVISDDQHTDHLSGMLDKSMLQKIIDVKDQLFYLCGPGAMVDDVRTALKEIGVAEDHIVTEEGW